MILPGMPRFPHLCLAVALLLLAFGRTPVHAQPVYRHALEHWEADPYQILVFHRSPLSAEQEAVLAAGTKAGPHANVQIRTLRLDRELPDDLAMLAKGVPAGADPWLMACFPAGSGIRLPILSAPLHATTLQGLLDSPVRRTLAQRLIEGSSAVWLLLESGQPPADNAAETQLREALDKQKQSLDPKNLWFDFTILRVARTDSAESRLVSMLLRSEESLSEIEAPIVFPIFGRGRVLRALAGPDIQPEAIGSVVSYLTGKSASEPKQGIPGVDLLINADWKQAIAIPPAAVKAVPMAVTPEKPAPPSPPNSPAPQAEPVAQAVDQGTSIWPVITALLLAAYVGWLLLRR